MTLPPDGLDRPSYDAMKSRGIHPQFPPTPPTREQFARLRSLFTGRTPPDVPSNFLIAPGNGRAMALGTPTPLVTTSFARIPNGLSMPAHSSAFPEPDDQFYYYATTPDIFGTSIPPGELIRLLGTRSRAAFLQFCAEALTKLEAPGIEDDVDRLFVDITFSGDELLRARSLMAAGRKILNPHALLVLAKMALILSPENPPAGEPEDWTNIVLAMFGVAEGLTDREFFGRPAVDGQMAGLPAEVALDLTSSLYFHSRSSSGYDLAHFRRIWQQIAPHLYRTSPDDYLDFAKVFRQAKRVPLADVVHVAAYIWVACSIGGPVVTLDNFSSLTMPAERIKPVLDLLSADQSSLAEMVRDEADTDDFGFAWTFSKLGQFPFIRGSEGSYLLISPRLLFHRVFGGLIYHDVYQHLAGERKRRGRVKRLREDATEKYALEVVSRIAPAVGGHRRIYTEKDLKRAYGEVQRCDSVIDYGDAFVLVEVTSRRLTRQSVAGRTLADLERDIELLAGAKAEQLDSTIRRLHQDESALTGLPSQPGRIFHPVIVVDDHFPVFPITMKGIRDHLATKGYLNGGHTTQLEIISIQELDYIEAVVENGGPTFQQLLKGKSGARLRDYPLVNYMLRELRLSWPMPSQADQLCQDLLQDALDAFTA